jgi:hypothetical protein
MKDATIALTPVGRQIPALASVTLALQRIRQAWRLLCLVGLGMLAAVILVSSVPLYARVAMTASLRSTIASSSQSADIVVRGQTTGVSSQNDEIPVGNVNLLTQFINQEFQHSLGPYLLPGQFSWQAALWKFLCPVPPACSVATPYPARMVSCAILSMR